MMTNAMVLHYSIQVKIHNNSKKYKTFKNGDIIVLAVLDCFLLLHLLFSQVRANKLIDLLTS